MGKSGLKTKTAWVMLAALVASACGEGSDPETSEDDIFWDPISTALGNSPNYAQVSNGTLMSVVSREFGRGSKAGALVEFFYPQYAKDNLWDSYVGVRVGSGKHQWSHQWKLAGQRVLSDSSVIQTDFSQGTLELRIEDVVRPKHNAHVRRLRLTNRGPSPVRDVQSAFYAFFTLQDFPAGDVVRFDATSGALLQRDRNDGVDVATAVVSDRPIHQVHCGNALQLLGREIDARIAVQRNTLGGCPAEIKAGVGGVNSAMTHRLGDLAPGASAEITYALGIGPSETAAINDARLALAGGFAARVAEDAQRWSDALSRGEMPSRMPQRARAVYRRALIAVLQHRVDNGAFIAAPTLTSPVYRFVWPRDGSKTSVDLLDVGYVDEAKAFFEFLETLLLPDGSFAVNYFPDGSKPLFNFGKEGNEHDQPGMLPYGVERVYERTRDLAWVRARYPAIARVAAHLLEISNGPDRLVGPSRDLWELETGKSWTYANASASSGLAAAGRLALALGNGADAARYTTRAQEIRDAVRRRLVTSNGYYARGIKGADLDERVEIANLAMGAGGFNLLLDTEPAMVRLGDEVRARLQTPRYGVKRYEGDRYYGGQPWPVAAVWVATHQLARGNRAEAEKLFAALTEQAYSTESLLIGEQFDEEKRQWLSAQPLVWSEAAYVRLARQLYGDEPLRVRTEP
jgi:GH15 family glucan-1,4-alpha-glucosidase